MRRWLHLPAAAAILFAGPMAAAEPPRGAAPTFTTRELSPVPNGQAVTRRIWLPGIDDGYVPQGVSFRDGALFISSYRSVDRQQNTGPCRLYEIDATSGALRGWLDLPAACGHAGGIARGSPGHIVVADTRVIFVVALSSDVNAKTIGRVVRTIKLAGAVKGSFAAGALDGLWLGAFERDAGTLLYKFPWDRLAVGVLSEADATASVAIPSLAQGAAVDPAGRLWVTRSTSRLGELVRIATATGAIEARYAMPIGTEDISFEPSGALWTLSEAGSRRWNNWSAFYPVALRYDPAQLK